MMRLYDNEDVLSIKASTAFLRLNGKTHILRRIAKSRRENLNMLIEYETESSYLGQFIPLHYHHNMLMDSARMQGFKAAINHAVCPGAKVLELGGGTGVLSWFAAAKAEKVWCVEFNTDMVTEARRLLSQNRDGHKVEVVHADAFEYLPPEPVDVVICEMIHVAMLREKQVQIIESFKQRYRQRFGLRLPLFIRSTVLRATMRPSCNFSILPLSRQARLNWPRHRSMPLSISTSLPRSGFSGRGRSAWSKTARSTPCASSQKTFLRFSWNSHRRSTG
jgi:SAM-dependent methyltransferase